MLRKTIVVVTLSLLSVGGLHADDQNRAGILNQWLQQPTANRSVGRQVQRPRHHTHSGARQAPTIYQTSGRPQQQTLQPAIQPPKPTPEQYTDLAPPIPDPNVSSAPLSQPVAGAVGQQVDPYHSQASYGPHVQHQYSTPASLYPAPHPGIPPQLGGTVINNPAFHPHEMLYPHRYKSMYGPYYYKVNGHWIATPFGVLSQENWKLKGTTVDVKYKSHISPFALFKRPVLR